MELQPGDQQDPAPGGGLPIIAGIAAPNEFSTLDPSVVHVVPLTSTIRRFGSEVRIDPDASNGLERPSAAQCQHLRAVSTGRIEQVRGNVGVQALRQIREVISVILDLMR